MEKRSSTNELDDFEDEEDEKKGCGKRIRPTREDTRGSSTDRLQKKQRNDDNNEEKGDEDEQDEERKEIKTMNSGRKRLIFPQSCQLTHLQKMLWAMKLGKDYPNFKPFLKEGRNRPYLTVDSLEAVNMLTTDGYLGTVMEIPEEREKLTKVIIFQYHVLLEPEYLLQDERFVTVWRRVVRGEKRSQLIALMKGEVPERVFISGAGYRGVAPYREEPILCMKCSRWGHKAWKCREDPRCRFCGRRHDSSVCREKIKAGERVTPSCPNCGLAHNATSAVCEARPKQEAARGSRGVPWTVVKQDRRTETGEQATQESIGQTMGETAGQNFENNVWKDTTKLRKSLAVGGGQGQVASIPPSNTGLDSNQEVQKTVLQVLKDLGNRIEEIEKRLDAVLKKTDKKVNSEIEKNENKITEKKEELDAVYEKCAASSELDGEEKIEKMKEDKKEELNKDMRIIIKGKEKIIKKNELFDISAEEFHKKLEVYNTTEKEKLIKKWDSVQKEFAFLKDPIIKRPRQLDILLL